MRKKITIAIIITVLLMNILIPNLIFAGSGVGSFKEVTTTPIDFEGIAEEGKGTVTPDNKSSRKEEIKETKTIGNTIASAVAFIGIVPVQTINSILSIFIYMFQDQEQYEFKVTSHFTIESLVMGRYTLFDINVFDIDNCKNETMKKVRENIALWYNSLRQIAIVISLLVLVYIGIRMALSTISTEQAKYKKMLTSWVTSIIILFTIHYIAIFFMEMQDQILNLFKGLTEGNTGFEEAVVVDTWKSLQEAEGFNKARYIIIYYVILYYQLKFVYLYFKRFLSIGLLITIAPLVTITYPIDKAGDNKAQAFSAWINEIIINIFIQVLHAIVYIVFIFSAAEIAKKVPFLGIVFLMALSRAEKLVRRTFSVGGEGLSDMKILEKLKVK